MENFELPEGYEWYTLKGNPANLNMKPVGRKKGEWIIY